MKFKLVKSAGISHFSYFVGSSGEAIIIDPRRDVDIYLSLSNEHNLRIVAIFETHRNEDYVTGSLELQARTGAAIYHGKEMDFAFGKPLGDGESVRVGQLILTAIETPGHSPESLSFVLTDLEVSTNPYMVFTGDALFSNDTGRTDFMGKERTGEMAEKLYNSIHGKILPLGDGVIVCPSHGAGSVCGSGISDHELTTIGYERLTNPPSPAGQGRFRGKKGGRKAQLSAVFCFHGEIQQGGAAHFGQSPPSSVFECEAAKGNAERGRPDTRRKGARGLCRRPHQGEHTHSQEHDSRICRMGAEC